METRFSTGEPKFIKSLRLFQLWYPFFVKKIFKTKKLKKKSCRNARLWYLYITHMQYIICYIIALFLSIKQYSAVCKCYFKLNADLLNPDFIPLQILCHLLYSQYNFLKKSIVDLNHIRETQKKLSSVFASIILETLIIFRVFPSYFLRFSSEVSI